MIPASVVVASFRPAALLRECLASLAPQCRAAGAELLVVRRRPEPDLYSTFPDLVRHVQAGFNDDVPRLRGRGIMEARGPWVVLTEDHCLAEDGWLERMLASRPGADVVGGGMGNARTERVVDWAVYFSEYGFFSSTRPHRGDPPLLTAANVAYSRSVAADVARWCCEGLWENVIHDRLHQRGHRLCFVPEARVRQNGTYAFGAFCRDRYRHGRDYARVRLAETGTRRWPRVVTAPAVAIVLTARVARMSFRESPLDFIRSLPVILAFLASWALGETLGYLSGPAALTADT